MDRPEQSSLRIVHCDAAVDEEALALAARAWPEAEAAAYGQAIRNLAQNGQTGSIVLLAARENDQLLAAQLAQSLPGRAAIVWPPQFWLTDETRRDSLAHLLFGRLELELRKRGVELAQALLPRSDEAATRFFELGRFSHAADLLYLTADAHGEAEMPPPAPFQLEAFTPDAEPRLIELLDRTYIGTLDCPRLDGLRNTADVVAGYKSVGTFSPKLWQIARHNGADVGCLLVNLHPDVKHAEIVYMGLVPEVRGWGWGLWLARHAQWLAQRASCDRTVLAVDAANEPAIRLYSAAGFFPFDQRAVWTRSLS